LAIKNNPFFFPKISSLHDKDCNIFISSNLFFSSSLKGFLLPLLFTQNYILKLHFSDQQNPKKCIHQC
jgi:hypothetical protein